MDIEKQTSSETHAFQSRILFRAIVLIGSITTLHASVELIFYNLSLWPSIMGVLFGIGYLALGFFRPVSWTPEKITPLIIIAGLSFLSARIWTMNGAEGASIGWYVVAPIVAMMFSTKGQVRAALLASAGSLALTMLACEYFPYHNYEEYPARLSKMLTWYVLVALAYNVHLLYQLNVFMGAEVMKQRARAQHNAKLASVGRLAGNLAHELNTPLTTILFLNQKLQKLLGENLTLEIKHIFERQKQIVGNTSATISTLLASTQLVAAQSKGVVHPNSVLSELHAMLDQKLRFSQIRLSSHVERGTTTVPLYSAQGAVVQALVILLNNSIDALDEKPKEDSKWIEVNFKYLDRELEIYVVDSGLGIPAESQAKLFEPYFSTKSSDKFSGLGLSVAKEIVDDLGGRLSYVAESENTKFKIVLPLEAAVQPQSVKKGAA